MKPLHTLLIGAGSVILLLFGGGVVGYKLKKCEASSNDTLLMVRADSLNDLVSLQNEVAQVFKAERDTAYAKLDRLRASEQPVSKQTRDAFHTLYGTDPDRIADRLLAEPVQPGWDESR